MTHRIILLILSSLVALHAIDFTYLHIGDEEKKEEHIEINALNYVNPALKTMVQNKMKSSMKVEKTEDFKAIKENNTVTQNVTLKEEKSANQTKSQDAPKKFGPERGPKLNMKTFGPNFEGTGPIEIQQQTTLDCNEFGKRSRFNPYSVLNSQWFAFYYWAADTAPLLLQFAVLSARETEYVRKIMDPLVEKPINWTARFVLMLDLLYNSTALLVEQQVDQGRFWLYPFVENYPVKMVPNEMQFRQSSDNKYIAMMVCAEERVYLLARRQDIPRIKKMPDVVAKMGYNTRGGRSYLYQGHHWMPIPEMDELDYWAPDKYKSKPEKDAQNELRAINGLPAIPDEDDEE